MPERFTSDDLMGLDVFEVAMRLSVGGRTLQPVTGVTAALPEAGSNGAALAGYSSERYGVTRADVETALRARIQTQGSSDQFGRRAVGGRS